jgi:ferric-dicitrate binding protein FerR (iron transport regulator)
MEPDDPLSDLDPLLCEALSWVVRSHSGEATRADLDELQQWRGMSAEHEEAFREASRLWRACREAARQLAEEAAAATAVADPPPAGARCDPLQDHSSTGSDASKIRLFSPKDR